MKHFRILEINTNGHIQYRPQKKNRITGNWKDIKFENYIYEFNTLEKCEEFINLEINGIPEPTIRVIKEYKKYENEFNI